jgi:hypothetical protein
VISGGLITHGEGVNPLELHGTVDSLEITSSFAAAGGGFEKIEPCVKRDGQMRRP